MKKGFFPLRFITNNIVLKITALLIAVIMWFLVTNMDDPRVRVRFTNVQVTLRNTTVVTDAGKVYTVEETSDVIPNVSFLAPRSISEFFTKDNIVAVADFENLTEGGTIPIELSVNRYGSEVTELSGSTREVRLSIEDRKSRTVALSAETTGVLSEGYIVGNAVSDQNLVRLTGPESRIDLVQSAIATVDVTGFTSDIGTQAEIRLFDADGNEVDEPSITQNIETVRVSVTILQTKEVGLNFHTIGEPASGFAVTGQIETTPQVITIAGRASALQDITSIEIDSDQLNVTGLRTDLQATVDVSRFLPTGTSFADPEFDGNITVTVQIGERESRTFTLSYDDIEIIDLPEGAEAVIGAMNGEMRSVNVTLTGLPETLSDIAISGLHGVIDGEDVVNEAASVTDDEPVYALVNFELPEGVMLSGDVTVPVYIERQ